MQAKSIAECSNGEHFAILSTFIKVLFVIKTFVLSNLSGRLRQVLLYWYGCTLQVKHSFYNYKEFSKRLKQRLGKSTHQGSTSNIQSFKRYKHLDLTLETQGSILIFSYLRRLGSFFWVQNFEFQYFLGFSEK